ncbi:MAG: hypothetical protein AB8I08_00840 [Sandaracinaceae bacterium]
MIHRLAVALVGLTAASACASDPAHTFPARDFVCATPDPACTTDTPSRDEATRTVALPFGRDGSTMAYVVSRITLPEARPVSGARPQAAGFNLDGMDVVESDTSGDCRGAAEDFVSTSEPGATGVDNAFQRFVPAVESLLTAEECPGGTTDGCLDATLLRQIQLGELLLLLEVEGLDDYLFDDAVTVRLSLGDVAGGGAPMQAGDTVAAGQTFTVGRTLGEPYAGDVFNGRLRIRADRFALSINTGDVPLEVVVRDAEVRFDISETGLSNGMIGGALLVTDIAAAAELAFEGGADIVGPIARGAADLDPSVADPTVCEAASVGITFEATSAVVER